MAVAQSVVDTAEKQTGLESHMQTTAVVRHEDVLRRVKGEFLEMPGMRLTAAQARRLWNLDTAQAEALLIALVEAHILSRTRDGAFVQAR